LIKHYAVERVCLDCGARLLGRSDKKFCSDQCRNNYNNRINRDQNNYVRNVHAQLRRNRKIIADLLDNGHGHIHRDALIAQGYNFTFFTHLVETQEGIKWAYCFEYGFREAGRGYLELRRSSSYLENLNEEED
jgi:predicted nucleic acid-binding Zn ribbon protein